MSSPWIAALIALFAWWFSTGAILVVVRMAERAAGRPKVVAGFGLPLLALGIYGYGATLGDAGVVPAYVAFFSALAIWGWIELAFLSGAITGPVQHDCPPGVPEWERFLRAWGTVAYHDILLTGVLILMWLHGEGAANQVGLWTFAVLYLARISAQLNLYLGVPRINLEFLPRALGHLASHFRIAPLNWVFPISITALSLASAFGFDRLLGADNPGDAVGSALLAAITALALLEHWLMVLPLPDAKLWRWLMPAPQTSIQKTRPEGANGL